MNKIYFTLEEEKSNSYLRVEINEATKERIMKAWLKDPNLKKKLDVGKTNTKNI